MTVLGSLVGTRGIRFLFTATNRKQPTNPASRQVWQPISTDHPPIPRQPAAPPSPDASEPARISHEPAEI